MKVLLSLAFVFVVLSQVRAQDNKIVCYWYPNDANAYVNPSPTLCTHIIISFMRVYGNGGLDFDGRDVKITGAIQKAKEWRSSNPNLKILIAIGGADYNFLSAWNSISANQQTRSYFASNIASKLEEYQLDGVDIDWEYPNNDPDTKPEEKGYFTSLLRDIKQRIGSSKILSTAIGAGSWRGDASYEIANIFSICDFVNVMTYDMHGSWFAQTGPHNALQGSNYVTVRSSIDYLLGKSVDRKKIIVGIATYGKVFYLENGDNNSIGAAIIRNRGSALNNSEICLKLRSNELTSQYSETYMVPYAFNRTAWISYENVRSVTEKANYIKNNGFGGAMFWSLEQDDYDGSCGGTRFSLISAVSNIVKGSESSSWQSPTTTQSPWQPPTTTQAPWQPPPTTTSSPSGAFTCPSTWGFFKDPADCSKFYQCAHGIAYSMSCPSGLRYNTKYQGCDWPENVVC